jgi:hypothetical protein
MSQSGASVDATAWARNSWDGHFGDIDAEKAQPFQCPQELLSASSFVTDIIFVTEDATLSMDLLSISETGADRMM